ncbi:MAG: hypothetical protein MUE71_05895 [Chitinophagaceae bacterium]|nr:hypothetical protein [Chitinophagaceae bacterium]
MVSQETDWLRVENISRKESGIRVVDDISFSMARGQNLAIMGETASSNP